MCERSLLLLKLLAYSPARRDIQLHSAGLFGGYAPSSLTRTLCLRAFCASKNKCALFVSKLYLCQFVLDSTDSWSEKEIQVSAFSECFLFLHKILFIHYLESE